MCFAFFFSCERDKCGAAAIAGFFQVFLSYFPIKETKTFKITVYCNKTWFNSTCYHLLRHTPGDLSFFSNLEVYSLPPGTHRDNS